MNIIKINDSNEIDLDTLIDTRLLVQANSGGGKSWLIRRLLEQSHGKVQQIVIDVEGEYSTLREKYDYILASKEGDIPADPKSAALLARKLLELNVSAIIDIYELNPYDRKHFVKLFLDSMVDAPKSLYHPVMVVIDEAHFFCPEKGQSEASDSVISLCSKGRKRGFCAVLATQRLSKLHKDAAAECNNKLIGRTGLDIDMKRASEELGFTSKEQYLSLRGLDAGEFFAFGPAISKEILKLKVGDVVTTHPKAGARIMTEKPVPPTKKMKDILSKLSDIPKEAQKEIDTLEVLKRENFELKTQIRRAGNTEAKIDHKELDAIRREHKIQIENMSSDLLKNLDGFLEKISNESNDLRMTIVNSSFPAKILNTPSLRDSIIIDKKSRLQNQDYNVSTKSLTGGAKRMVQVLASRYPMKFSKSQLATLSHLSPRSGTYGTYLSFLRSGGLIEFENDLIGITELGLQQLGNDIPVKQESPIEMWKSNLTGGARRMFEILIDKAPNGISREQLAIESGLEATSGTFGTYLSMLRGNGLIQVQGQQVQVSLNLFI